ncbi:MAG: deoxyguanosinetriphosphate triphosphohydrolase [Candidatus Margulisiibacteriota bacterium]
MRTQFEAVEEQILAPYAVLAKCSQGRIFPEEPSQNRTCFQRDRDRIIHAKAFRRLKHKTQVFIANESDHYRSRLTHTLEVAQISRHLSRLLRVNEDLSECIALAHDLGHTPFGHSGERELSRLLKDDGGFEHNAHSLRIVDRLETKYPQFPGLNLSHEVRMGLMKHTTPWDQPDRVHAVSTIEAQLVNLADEIAYNNHDLDDGLTSTILTHAELESQVVLWKEAKKAIQKTYSNLSDADLKYLINSYLISWQIDDVVHTTRAAIADKGIHTFEELQKVHQVVVQFSPEMKEKNKALRHYLFHTFYSHYSVYRMNKKGQQIIRALYEAFTEDPKLLSENYRSKISADYPIARVVADYVAGMTDVFALKEYNALFA